MRVSSDDSASGSRSRPLDPLLIPTYTPPSIPPTQDHRSSVFLPRIDLRLFAFFLFFFHLPTTRCTQYTPRPPPFERFCVERSGIDVSQNQPPKPDPEIRHINCLRGVLKQHPVEPRVKLFVFQKFVCKCSCETLRTDG